MILLPLWPYQRYSRLDPGERFAWRLVRLGRRCSLLSSFKARAWLFWACPRSGQGFRVDLCHEKNALSQPCTSHASMNSATSNVLGFDFEEDPPGIFWRK